MAQRFALAAILASCAAMARAEHTFEIRREVLMERVAVVAQAPCSNRGELEVPGAARARYEARLSAGLAAAGLRVVPPAEVSRVWRTAAEPLGGVFDPISGERDASEWRIVREHTLRELQRLHGADALLDCQLFDLRTLPETRPNGFALDFVAAGEALTSTGGWALRSVKYVHVLAAGITLHDRSDSLLYSAAEQVAWIALRNADSWVERSSEDVFSPAHDARIDLLLEPLRNSKESAATPPEAP